MHADLHLAMTTLFRFDTPRNILLSLILLAIPLVAALGLRHRLRSAARVAPILTRLEWPLVLAFPPMFAAFFMPELSHCVSPDVPAFCRSCTANPIPVNLGSM